MSVTGIVIVTFNAEAEIGACLESALRTGAEVIVVDNASSDGTVERAQGLGARVIGNRENRGFAAAVNQGVRSTVADRILLLNPDAVLLTGIEKLEEACEGKKMGAVGGKLVDATGRAQAGFNIRRLPTPAALICEVLLVNRLWPGNPVNWHYRCYDISHDVSGNVEQPAGAFLMFRREVWESLGGFDERFTPIWFEDVDFCRRLLDQGYHSYYESRCVASHEGGHSIRKITLEKRELYWYGNLLKYGFKHFRPVSTQVLCLAVIVGSILRMAVGMAVHRSFKPIRIYIRVIGLAGRYLLFGPSKVGVPTFT